MDIHLASLRSTSTTVGAARSSPKALHVLWGRGVWMRRCAFSHKNIHGPPCLPAQVDDVSGAPDDVRGQEEVVEEARVGADLVGGGKGRDVCM